MTNSSKRFIINAYGEADILYNDHRPATFEEVIGQPSAKVLLNFSMMVTDAKKRKKIPHAFLISGTRGTGKTTLARLFAQGLNCKRIGEKFPCGKCLSCQQIGPNHPDIVEIDSAASGSGDRVQALVEQMRFIPHFRRKVFIFDEAQMLTKTAMAMLLKTIEEPSRGTVVILLTTDPDKIDRALRSRCTWLALRNLSQQELTRLIAKVAVKERLPVKKEAVVRLAQYGNGSARDALSVLETMTGYNPISLETVEMVVGHRADVSALVQCLEDRNVSGALNEVNTLCSRYSPVTVAESMSEALVEKMRAQVDKSQPVSHLVKWIELFQHCRKEKSEWTPQLPLELAVVECASAAQFIPPPEILMTDVEAFAAYVRRTSERLARTIMKLEFVRIKKGSVVVFRTQLRSLKSELVVAIQKSMQRYLRNKELKMEILYAD